MPLYGPFVDQLPWTSYVATLTSEAGGAIGTPTSVTAFTKKIGKTRHITITIVMGATGLGTATQIGISLPSTAGHNTQLLARNRTSSLDGVGDVGIVDLTKALLQTYAGAPLGGNNDTMVISGTYDEP